MSGWRKPERLHYVARSVLGTVVTASAIGGGVMGCHLPEQELLESGGLAALQRAKLAHMLGEVLRANSFYRSKLEAVRFDATRDPFEALPFTTRVEIEHDQTASPPFGTNLTFPKQAYCRYHQTSGSAGAPLRWLDTSASWEWWKRCWATIYRAAGVGPADRLVFTFSFGPFIGFWSAFEAATSLGNLCLAAGGMSTAARLQYIRDNGVTFVCCTPTYALRMVDAALEAGLPLADYGVRGLILAGEPGANIPSTRARIEQSWGARVFDHAGMTEMGPWGFECEENPGGLHINEAEFIAEVIDPRSATPAVSGAIGELVLTNLGRIGSPLIRYRTGDLVRCEQGRCACGRHFARCVGGVLGRCDDMLIIRGNNVFPSAVEDILRGFPEVAEFRLRVDSRGCLGELQVEVEAAPHADGARLAQQVSIALRDRLHFKPLVQVVSAGALPRFEMKSRRVVRSESDDV